MNTNKDIQELSAAHAAFEKWCESEGFDTQSYTDKNGKHYSINATAARWTGWYACTFLAIHQPSPESSQHADGAALTLETLLQCATQAGLGKFWLDGDKMPRSDGYLIGQDFFTRLHERIVVAQTKNS